MHSESPTKRPLPPTNQNDTPSPKSPKTKFKTDPHSDQVVGLSETAHGLVFEHIDSEEAEFLFEEIFVRKSYLGDPVVLPPDVEGVVVVDVGANIGFVFGIFF